MLRRPRSLIPVTLVAFLLLVPACGLRHHTVKARQGTLSITPPAGKAGASFMLVAGGFRPGEAMTFEIDSPPPSKTRFIGPSHTADQQGAVSSTFVPQSGDAPGVYQVLAVGNQGTRAQGTLTITN
ncbi:MAG: hypothetical protein QOJ52_242 [Acidimicrobiaceae bacterium]|nr:hypothetical protein [Acidimicrobiaceae bacterium]MDQ1418280.1 hypothetical protein [Acidimicrobiaceae bacterium]